MSSATGTDGPTTAVIVTTYNQARCLELILAALEAQTDPHFDVVVADDGSDPPASEVVRRLEGQLRFGIRTHWQEDDGFRKARIQNVAAASTDAELLVFLDGDCIPFRDLIESYRSAYRPGEFQVGAVSYLDRTTTDRLTPEEVRAGEHERSLGRREAWRVRGVHLKNLWHAGRKQTRPRLKGGNFAVSSRLFRRVDGFDEAYSGFAKEDSDLRNRMRYAGARGRSLWHRARVCHIAWERPFGRGREYPSAAMYDAGRTRVRARKGLSSHLPADAR